MDTGVRVPLVDAPHAAQCKTPLVAAIRHSLAPYKRDNWRYKALKDTELRIMGPLGTSCAFTRVDVLLHVPRFPPNEKASTC